MLDVDVDVSDEIAQALVSPRMSVFRPSATALADACGWASVIWTSPADNGGVAVLEGKLSGVLLKLYALTLTGLFAGPAKVLVGGPAATLPLDEGGAESAMSVACFTRAVAVLVGHSWRMIPNSGVRKSPQTSQNSGLVTERRTFICR